MKKALAAALLASALVWPAFSQAGEIQLTVETPEANGTATGVDTISGWAVSTAGIQKVELYLNGNFITQIPYGLTRKDVENAFPTAPDSEYSGFGMAWAFSLLPTGPQSLVIRATDKDGDMLERVVNINVEAFHEQFFSDANAIDVSEAEFEYAGETLLVKNLVADGRAYNVTLEWQNSRQAFYIVSIDPVI